MKDPFLYIIECIICSALFLAIYRLCIGTEVLDD